MRRQLLKSVGVVLLLTLCCTSCTSSKPSSPPLANPTPVKAYVPEDEQGNELTPPEIVRSKQVQNDNRGVKTLTVGNDKGDCVLSCNMEASNCVTPAPGKDYYVFDKTTKWKFPGADSSIARQRGFVRLNLQPKMKGIDKLVASLLKG